MKATFILSAIFMFIFSLGANAQIQNKAAKVQPMQKAAPAIKGVLETTAACPVEKPGGPHMGHCMLYPHGYADPKAECPCICEAPRTWAELVDGTFSCVEVAK